MVPPVGNVAVAAAAVGLAPDLKKRVEIMAEHVARAGAEFELSVKTKNAGNPQYAFLAGGDGAEYYQALLQAHYTASANASPPGHGQSALSPATELAELLWRWPEPQAPPLAAEMERHLSDIIGGLEHMASRDSIRAGREWIEANTPLATSAIAGSVMKRIRYLATCAHRLHLLFLLHDVLQAEFARQEAYRPIIAAFRPYLAWILRPAFQLAHSAPPNSDECQKVLKLLSLWQERGILGVTEAAEIRLLVTAQDLPAVPIKPASAPGSLNQQLVGLAPGLLQQVQAQVQAQQAQQQASVVPAPPPPPPPRPVALGGHHHLAVLPVVVRPPQPTAAALPQPPPNFTGVLRPLLPGLAGAALAPGPTVVLPPGVQAVAPLPGRGGHTPETVPVGVMAAMLKQVSKRGKDLHTAFVPYKPLDPLYTPHTAPPVAPATARLMERLAEYYEIVGHCAREPGAGPPASAAAAAGKASSEAGHRGNGAVGGSGASGRSRSRSRSPAAEAGAAARHHMGDPSAPAGANAARVSAAIPMPNGTLSAEAID